MTVTMKLSSYVFVVLSASAYVFAAPTAESNAAVDEPAVNQLEARDLTHAQCVTACNKGVEAVEDLCRVIPQKLVRKFCWEAAAAVHTPAGKQACVGFCDSWF